MDVRIEGTEDGVVLELEVGIGVADLSATLTDWAMSGLALFRLLSCAKRDSEGHPLVWNWRKER